MREGTVLDPEKLFFDEQGYADERVDCEGSIIAPGFIDVQINGTHTLHTPRTVQESGSWTRPLSLQEDTASTSLRPRTMSAAGFLL